VFAHNDFDFDEKGLAHKDRDARKENRWTETNHGITTDARQLNEYRDMQGDHHDKDDRSHGKSGNHQNKDNDNEHRSEEKHGTHRFEDNDDDHRSEEKHGDHRFNGSDNDHRSEEEHGTQRFKDNDDDHRSEEEEEHEDHRFERNDEDHQSEDEYEATRENRLPGEGHIANGTRSKNSSGGHLRAHNDRKGTRENKDEDDGFGLPILVGSVGAALIFGFVLAGIVVLCYRRRISTKSSVVEIGVVVVGQPVANSVPKDETTANGNSANKVSK
jgi:hypothetical protein